MSTREALLAAALAGSTGESPTRERIDRRRAKLLQSVPLFAGLSARDVRRIAALATESTFGAGRTIVQRGVRGDAFYLIVEGTAKVYRTLVPTGRAIARLGEGDFFGEMALLDGGPRTATVVAETRVVAVKLPRAGFRRLLLAEPTVTLRLLEVMTQRAREAAPIASQ
jgi:CRP-like cAMP-binding protein